MKNMAPHTKHSLNVLTDLILYTYSHLIYTLMPAQYYLPVLLLRSPPPFPATDGSAIVQSPISNVVVV